MASPVSYLAFRILDGSVETIMLPDDGLVVPELDCGDGPDTVRMLPGYEADGVSTTVTIVAALAARITPGVTWYLAPKINDPEPKFAQGGCAYGHFSAGPDARRVVFLSTASAPRETLTLALHEAAHAVEGALTWDELAILDTAVARGTRFFCAYSDDPIERRAELVAHIGAAVEGGLRLVPHPETPEIAVIGRILSGEVGRRRFDPVPEPARQQCGVVRDHAWIRALRAVGLGSVADWFAVPV